MNSKERVLITGGAGFIGSHLVDAYCERGFQVAVMDNFSTGSRANLNPRASLYEADITDAAAVGNAVRDFRPAIVNHHAAQASVFLSVQNPAHDAAVNVLGTINILQAAVEVQAKTFLFASTGGAIYGEVPEGELATIESPANPASPYAMSKLAAERYIAWYAAEHSIDCRILRYANVYGPRQDPKGEAGVVAIFLQKLLAGEQLKINARREQGDAGCVRDYIVVGDVVAANMAASSKEWDLAVCNVSTGIGTTTLQLAKQMQQMLGISSEIEFAEMRPGDVERSVLDPGLFSDFVQAPTPLQEGLQQTAHWFQQRS